MFTLVPLLLRLRSLNPDGKIVVGSKNNRT